MSIADSPAVKKMRADVDAMTKATEERSRAQLRTRVAGALTAAGFTDKERARHALVHLEAEKLVSWGDDNEAKFVDDDGAVELAAGLKKFASSEVGKVFLPAPSTTTKPTPQRESAITAFREGGESDISRDGLAALLDKIF